MPNFRIKSLADENRIEELVALNAGIHNESPSFFKKLFNDNPENSRPDFHRFILEDEKIVAGTSLLRHRLRWYSSEIQSGEIGLVGTLEEYRGKGYSAALMNSCLETLRNEGIPLCFLWGIPNYYQRFHFHYAYPNHSTAYVSIPKSCTTDWEPSGTIRPADKADLAAIKRLYESYNMGLIGSEIRSEAMWKYYFDLSSGRSDAKWWMTDDPAGCYAFVAGEKSAVWEIAATSMTSLRNIVTGLFANYPGIECLDFYHHPDMPVGQWLYRNGAMLRSPEDIWKGTWGGMVRLMNPAGLMELMSETLSERLQNSRFYNFKGELPIESEVGSALISIDDGKVAVHESSSDKGLYIPASALTPIMTGYRGFARFRGELKDIPDATAELLSVLFQRDTVFMYAMLYSEEAFCD